MTNTTPFPKQHYPNNVARLQPSSRAPQPRRLAPQQPVSTPMFRYPQPPPAPKKKQTIPRVQKDAVSAIINPPIPPMTLDQWSGNWESVVRKATSASGLCTHSPAPLSGFRDFGPR